MTKEHRKRLLFGLFLSSGIGLLAYKRRSLSRGGVAGATITGTATVGAGGWPWGFALIFFFVSSTLLSHFRVQDKERTAADKFSKGSQRDLAQVAANGGVATGLALAHGLARSSTTKELLHAGYLGALATATADTWATELGVLSPHPPRLLTTGEITTPGTSGGITPLGTAAAASGALSLGLFSLLLSLKQKGAQYFPFLTLLSGFAGSMIDSVLGATVQAMYYCSTCQQETEQPIHRCGTHTRPLRGYSWCNNDVVNFLATLCGSLIAAGAYGLSVILARKER
uniref:DUF92 domain-containing protein n=1 Tax=Thermosporothrix sp. COM3 TaxID=2490863 RepID=A0A455SZ94_9CHLR|nr:hypothetical protein KTC_52350 [Thermosporothrix sp. COM3]